MKTAFHPTDDRKITVQEYLSEFGARIGPDGKRRTRQNSRCPACNEPMKIYGEDRARRDQVFSHLQNRDPPLCPLRNSADHRYVFLTEAPQDSEEGRKLRQIFFDHWAKHWDLMRRLLDRYMDVKDFIHLIREADRTRLWNRPNLSEWEIPYILLVWKEWKPVVKGQNGSVLRKEWFRFWFDSNVRTFEDIWIRTEGISRIIRARYTPPRGDAVPGISHLIEADIITIDTGFLEAQHKTPHEFVIRTMQKEFPVEMKDWVLN